MIFSQKASRQLGYTKYVFTGEALRPEGAIPTTRLTRENWVSLFPIGHQAAYIRDEDQGGVM